MSGAVARAIALALLLLAVPARAIASCPGDCDDSGRVAIQELILAVDVALDRASLGACGKADADADGQVTVDELLRAVSAFLGGCPTETPTSSATATFSATPAASHTAGPPATFTSTATIAIATATPTETPTSSPTRSDTPTLGPSDSPTPTPSLTSTPTHTPTSSHTPSETPTRTRGPVEMVREVIPLGDDFFVIGGFQPPVDLDVCSGADGSFASVFLLSGRRIIERAFDRLGAPIAGASDVVGQCCGSSSFFSPSVACEQDGDFSVVWTGPPSDSISFAPSRVFGRRYTSLGESVGTEFQINTYTPGSPFGTAVEIAASGLQLVVWDQSRDGDEGGVFARRIAGDGAPLGLDFQVNSFTPGDQSGPAVTADGAGRFVVVWTSVGQDGDGAGAFGRRLSSSGQPLGNEFQINVRTSGDAAQTDVAAAPDGSFLVVWREEGRDGSDGAVVARRFSSGGDPLGGEFLVNSYTAGEQTYPNVAGDGAGTFTVVWESAYQDGEFSGVFARRLASDGAPLGAEFQVNEFTLTSQERPHVASASSGTFVVVWDGFDGTYGHRFGVFPAALDELAPCPGRADRWSFEIEAGEELTVRLDTADRATAADLCFRADCGTFSFDGDDETPCRFAPSSFACAAATLIAPASATCELEVGVCSDVCADADRADYSLLVYADQAAVPITPGPNDVPFTPTGTPKMTPTPTFTASVTPTATRPPSEVRSLVPLVYRSLNGTVYVVVPGIEDDLVRITSLAVTTGDLTVEAERFSSAVGDRVLTALAASSSGLVPLAALRRTGIVGGLGGNPIEIPPSFRPCEVSGEGLLLLPGGTRVTGAGAGPHAPGAPPVVDAAVSSPAVPAAISKLIRRRINRGTVGRRTFVFPSSAAECVTGAKAGESCSSDSDCETGCALVGQGCCGLASDPPTCSAEAVVCDPAEPNSCIGFGTCSRFGGEKEGQGVSLDETVDAPAGNPASQPQGADGILLDGRCLTPQSCQAIVFVIDAGGSAADIHVGVAGFLVDENDVVIGTVGGFGEEGEVVHPGSVQTCSRAEEFEVDTYTLGEHQSPSVCSDAEGGFVVVWDDLRDGGGRGIVGRRYASDGSSPGSEFQVSAYTAAYDVSSAVACDEDGDAVVVWMRNSFAQSQIVGRRVSRTEGPFGQEFQVSSATAGSYYPAVAPAGDGGFVVVWESRAGPNETEILARRFQTDGASLGGELQIAAPSSGFGRFPAVSADADGDFVVAWLEPDYPQAILGRRFASSGDGPLVELEIEAPVGRPSVGGEANGDFVVVWATFGDFFGQGRGVKGRRYASSGARLGSQFTVSTVRPYAAEVASDADGDFVVTWQTRDFDVPDAVFARRYSSAGGPIEDEVPLNVMPSTIGAQPEAASSAGGDFVVVWQEATVLPEYGGYQALGIFGQRLRRVGATSATTETPGALGAQAEVGGGGGAAAVGEVQIGARRTTGAQLVEAGCRTRGLPKR